MELELERNEVIALVNLLDRFSSSISYYQSMSLALEQAGPEERVTAGMSLRPRPALRWPS